MDAGYLLARNFIATSYDSLSREVVEATKKLILDQIGVELGGSSRPGVKELLELLTEWGGREECTTLCFGRKLPAPHAGQLNAVMGHALDYDDTHDIAMMHPAVVMVPTSLAMAEQRGGLSGKDFITAVTLGIDMISRLGLATRPGTNLMHTGWHYTTLYGFLTAPLVAGKIMGLNEEKMVSALGIGYHQASGNGQTVLDGTLTKRMGPGFAVRGGIAAALMAEKGITGARNSIEGEFGLFAIYHQGLYSRQILTADLGKHFEGVNVSIKPYPCCRAIHPFIDATLAILNEHPVQAEDIEKITITCHEGNFKVLGDPLEVKCRPRSTVDAQFSIPWGVATMIARGKVTMENYTEAAIKSPDILAVTGKIKVDLDPAPSKATLIDPGRVKITTRSGEAYYQEIVHPLGSPQRPLSFEQCAKKFRDCASYAARKLPDKNIETVIEMIGRLEKLDDVRKMIALLS
jgi:2-methylcitrate dehydratase PrpD